MRITRILTLAILLLIAACGEGEGASATTTTIPSSTLTGSIHRSGGIAGLDDTWVLEADGTVLGPDGATGRMTAADLAALEAAVEAASFFELDAEYLPADTCCDRFTYVVTLSDGVHEHTVTTIDAADAPASLFSLIQVFLNGVQAAS